MMDCCWNSAMPIQMELALALATGEKLKSLSSAALSDTWQESKGHFCINLEVGKVIDKFTEKETDQPRIIR